MAWIDKDVNPKTHSVVPSTKLPTITDVIVPFADDTMGRVCQATPREEKAA